MCVGNLSTRLKRVPIRKAPKGITCHADSREYVVALTLVFLSKDHASIIHLCWLHTSEKEVEKTLDKAIPRLPSLQIGTAVRLP